MPVDTSSYNTTIQPFNPVQTLGAAANIQNAMNQNRLFQQEYNSKLGVSQLYKGAVDPNTGVLDASKIPNMLAGPQGDSVSLGLPEAIANSQAAQLQQQKIQSGQLALAKQHLDTTASYLTPLANKVSQAESDPKKPNVTSQDVVGALSQAMTVGHVDPSTAAQLYASLPTVGGVPISQGGKIDESQVPAFIKQM